MSGFRDVEMLPFLHELEESFTDIRQEVEQLEENYHQIQEMIRKFLYPNPKSKLPRTTDTWMTFGFYALGKKTTDLAHDLRVTQTNENPTDEEIDAFCRTLDYMYETVLPKTSKAVNEFFQRNQDDVLMVSLFRLADQRFLPVHTNYDPFMYRCHMGVLVPEGDIGMMVEGETTVWPEGEFIVFDSSRPHTVWNFTGKARYVLNVDVYRPEYCRKDLKAVRDVLVDLRLKESKLTFGLSGGRAELPMSEKRKYACHHENLDEDKKEAVH